MEWKRKALSTAARTALIYQARAKCETAPDSLIIQRSGAGRRLAPRLNSQEKVKEKLTALSASAGGVGALAAAFASFCCIGPAVFALVGATSLTFSALLAPYRLHLLAISLILLAIAFWRLRRSQANCAEGECLPRASRVLRAALWGSLVVWAASAVSYAAAEWPRLVGPRGSVREHAAISADANPLRAAFNTDAGKVRVLMLVAPT